MNKQIIEMAEYINRILRSKFRISASWGMCNAHATLYNQMAGLRFYVSGFLHTGEVVVVGKESSDTFDVFLLDEKEEEIDTIRGVKFDMLVDSVDKLVETSDENSQSYKEKCQKFMDDNLGKI